MEADFRVEALKETLDKYGPPEIMNGPSRNIASQYPARQWIREISATASNGPAR